MSGDATFCYFRGELLRAPPPQLIDDFIPSTATISPSTNERYMCHDSIYYYACCFDHDVVHHVTTNVVPFNYYVRDSRPYEIVMIYVLVLISKLPTFSTFSTYGC